MSIVERVVAPYAGHLSRIDPDDPDCMKLVARVMEENPQATRDEVARICSERVGATAKGPDAEFLRSALLYCWRNMFYAISRSRRLPRNSSPEEFEELERQALEQQEQIRQSTEMAVANFAKAVLMELDTPYGKPLGKLTGAEGRKLTGWMGAVFKDVPDDGILEDYKTEDDLRVAERRVRL